MQILAIDYGQKRSGLAIGDADTRLAEPLKVIRHRSVEEAIRKVLQVEEVDKVEKVLIGLSKGINDKKATEFGMLIKDKLGAEVIFWDEKFSTVFAIDKSIEAGIKKSKRKEMTDAYAAAVILENYFESLD